MRRRNRSGARAWPPLRGLAPLVIGLVVWQIVGDPDSPYYPAPSAWWKAVRQLAGEGSLWPAVGHTMVTFVVSLVVALVLGAAVGAAVGASRGFSRAVGPLFELLRTVPPPVIVPIAALAIGTNRAMAVLVVSFAAVWPVLLNSAAAMRAVPAVRLEGARSLRLSPSTRLFKVILPSLTPGIVLGLRVAVPIALIVTLVVELLSATGGLGSLLLTAERNFDSGAVFGVMAVTAIIGLLLNVAVAAFESRMNRNWEGAG